MFTEHWPYAVLRDQSCWGGLGQARGNTADRELVARTRPHAFAAGGLKVLNLHLAQSHHAQLFNKNVCDAVSSRLLG
jgi:hypothetical protein